MTISIISVEGARLYRPDGEDEVYPSVTTILAATGPRKYGLERWKAQHGEAGDVLRDIAANRGKRLHAAIAHFRSTGEAPKNPDPFWLSVESFVRFLCGMFPRFAAEHPMIHAVDGYGGTPDDVSVTADHQLVIHDWKSGTKPKDKAQLEECFVQIGGYADLVAFNSESRPTRAAVVVAIPNREPQVVPVNLARWVPEWRRRLEMYKGSMS